MKEKERPVDNKKKYIKMIPIVVIGIIAVILIVLIKSSKEPLSVDTILRYTPENMYLAAAVLFLFFALKSLTVVLPLTVLYLASGVLFSPIRALFISVCGLSITITIPYLIGRFNGKEVVKEIQKKYPKTKTIMEYQRENTFFACFITRIVGVLPGDIVSLYFGACETRYGVYLIGGIAGSLLSIVTTTILGEKISQPFSTGFFVVLLCRILVSVSSILINYRLNKRKKEDS